MKFDEVMINGTRIKRVPKKREIKKAESDIEDLLQNRPPPGTKARRVDDRMRQYGLTVYGFEKMLRDQGAKCPICLGWLEETPNVDHCHETNNVRGLLCRHCNLGLGCFKDDEKALFRAAEYIIKHKGLRKLG